MAKKPIHTPAEYKSPPAGYKGGPGTYDGEKGYPGRTSGHSGPPEKVRDANVGNPKPPKTQNY